MEMFEAVHDWKDLWSIRRIFIKRIVFPRTMEDHLNELQEQLDNHEKRKKERYLGHRTNRAFYAAIVVLVLIVVVLILADQVAIHHLKDKQARTLTENAYLQSELIHYKAAYRSALQDAQAFGKIYDITYANGTPETNDLNKSNGSVATARVLPPPTKSGPKTLPGTNAWDYYAKQGVINDSCIPTTKVVQTDGSTVDVVVIASGKEGKEWPKLMVVIDGAPVGTYTADSKEQQVFKTSVVMPAGTHHLDILFLNGDRAKSVSIPFVRIGDRTLENAVSIIDYGTSFQALDCKETTAGDTLTKTGALRYRIEKL